MQIRIGRVLAKSGRRWNNLGDILDLAVLPHYLAGLLHPGHVLGAKNLTVELSLDLGRMSLRVDDKPVTPVKEVAIQAVALVVAHGPLGHHPDGGVGRKDVGQGREWLISTICRVDSGLHHVGPLLKGGLQHGHSHLTHRPNKPVKRICVSGINSGLLLLGLRLNLGPLYLVLVGGHLLLLVSYLHPDVRLGVDAHASQGGRDIRSAARVL